MGECTEKSCSTHWLDRVSWVPLLAIALMLGLAPFQPEPHLVEKVRMLVQGVLSRPIDIFDLCLHSAPLVVVALKARRAWMQKNAATGKAA